MPCYNRGTSGKPDAHVQGIRKGPIGSYDVGLRTCAMITKSAHPLSTVGTLSNVPSLIDTDSWLILCLNTSRIPALGSIAFKEAIFVSSSLSPSKARVNKPVPAPTLQRRFVNPLTAVRYERHLLDDIQWSCGLNSLFDETNAVLRIRGSHSDGYVSQAWTVVEMCTALPVIELVCSGCKPHLGDRVYLGGHGAHEGEMTGQ